MTDKIDNGSDTVITDGKDTSFRSQMLASVATLAAASIRAEQRLGDTAKAWGHNLFAAVYTDGGNMDDLIGQSKLAAGWKTLSTSEAGRKTKQRLDVYFSNARLVAERFSTLTDEQRADVLNGKSSIHYLASEFRKADAVIRKAAKATEAAEKASEAADGADAPPVPESIDVATLTLSQLGEMILNRYQLATDEEKSEAHPAFELLFDAFNADIEAAAMALDNVDASHSEDERIAA